MILCRHNAKQATERATNRRVDFIIAVQPRCKIWLTLQCRRFQGLRIVVHSRHRQHARLVQVE